MLTAEHLCPTIALSNMAAPPSRFQNMFTIMAADTSAPPSRFACSFPLWVDIYIYLSVSFALSLYICIYKLYGHILPTNNLFYQWPPTFCLDNSPTLFTSYV